MTINIITICTGKYEMFFESFYKSCEKFFLKEHTKKFFVFTDGDLIKNSDTINKISQKKLGWPYDTMMRFKMFNSISEKLLESDYTFFFNANMIFVNDVGDEVLPNESTDFLMGVNHPGFFNKSNFEFTYERNINSQFYIPFGDGKFYYQGCFNGGRTSEFLTMSKELDEKIDIDLSKGIIPVWHDESALNWYYSKINPLIVSPSYAYPESSSLNLPKKIIQIDKSKLGGHNYLRN